jgi:uncharacterized protein YjcR
VARKRDPRRDEAYEIWKKEKGKIRLKDIAEQLGVSEGTVRGWKSKDKWRVFPKIGPPKGNKNAKGKGAPKGNKNAKGHGAPKGNRNAKGHGAPPKNDNAVTTGEYKNFWEDVLDDDEIEKIQSMEEINIVEETKSEIRLYSLRERDMLKKIKQLKSQTSYVSKVTKELTKVDDYVQVKNPNGEGYTTERIKVDKLIPKKMDEYRVNTADEELKLQEALTRVQDKKVKAIKQLHEVTDSFEFRKFVEEEKIKISRERLDLEKNKNNPFAELLGAAAQNDEDEDDLF